MNTHTLFTALVLCYAPQTLLAADPVSYLGLIHPPNPTECKSKGGGIFGSDQAGNDLAFAQVECKRKKMLWLDRFLRREGKHAIWQVEDVIVFPVLRKSQSIFTTDCEFKRDQSAQVVAIGTWVSREVGGYVKGITNAWALNSTTKKIVRISPHEVSCEVNDDRD